MDSGRTWDEEGTHARSPGYAGLWMSYENSDLKEESLLARGSSFHVIAVVHVPTGVKLAVKALAPSSYGLGLQLERERARLARQLAREAHLLLSIRHHHILEAIAFDAGRLLLARLHATLRDELPGDRDSTAVWTRRAALKRWPLARSLRLGLELARAIDHCHNVAFRDRNMRLLHRGLKPTNIGLKPDGRLVLFDFKLARLWEIGPDDNDGTEVRTYTTVGSPRYMAPECCMGEAYNHKADVYAWGLVMWEMAAHERPPSPFAPAAPATSASRGAPPMAALHQRPKLKDGWPSELTSLLEDAWAPQPGDRPEIASIVPRLTALFDATLAAETAQQQGKPGSGGLLSYRGSSKAMSRILGPLGFKAPPLSSATACELDVSRMSTPVDAPKATGHRHAST